MNKILAFGEILWDMIEGEAHLGGAPLNFAAHVKKCGLTSAIVSCVGNDALGDKAISEVRRLGVIDDLILRRNKKTGIVKVELIDGQPDYEILKPSAYDYIDSGRLDHESMNTYDCFYFGTLAQRADSSRIALSDIFSRHSFKHIFYDVNLRKNSYTADIVSHSLAHATIFKINDEEVPVVAEMLFGEQLSFQEFCEQLTAKFSNISIIIITAGGDGCLVFENKRLSKVGSQPVKVADTVGAGDSFSAAFVVSYLKSGNAIRAAEVANRVGGFVASKSGAIPDYSKQVEALFD